MGDLIKSNIQIIKNTIKEKSLGVLESKINEYSMNLLSFDYTKSRYKLLSRCKSFSFNGYS